MSSCQSETSFQFSTYWWKNSTELNEEHKEFLNQNNINEIYLRIFDLKFDEKNGSILIPKVNSSFPNSTIKKIPVIYIENAILLNFRIDSIYNLIIQNITRAKNIGIITSTDILQIDCDWTLKTKEPYFKLLSILSKDIKSLSATIRLHQIKYAKSTGIPPVNKGVMMIYNLESPTDTNTQNSIFTYDKAVQYLYGYLTDYPLQLDVALPAFSWGVHYHHGVIKNLISDFDPNDIDSINMKKKKNGYFKAKKAHFYNRHRISKRDEIRYEYPKIKEVKKIINFLKENLKQDNTEIIFFSLNSNFLINNKKKYEEIISIYQ
tara:strand:+ start:9988 stop:10947 length:960 start_codon:yes stop_codon:yes gene_type:complete